MLKAALGSMGGVRNEHISFLGTVDVALGVLLVSVGAHWHWCEGDVLVPVGRNCYWHGSSSKLTTACLALRG